MQQILVRAVSGLVATAVLLPIAFVGGWWFAALGAGVIGVCLSEYFAMTLPEDPVSGRAGTVLGLLLFFFVLTGSAVGDGGVVLLAGLPIVSVLWFLLRTGAMETVAPRMGLSVLGLVWVGGLGAMSSSLVYLEEGFAWLVLATGIAFGSDIGGYFAGRAFGRTKLYEKISPKKTWEGAVGGVLFALVVAFFLRSLLGPTIAATHLAIVAPLTAALGQLGDLAQSMLKRSVGVKDSGRIMPGHGGLFDRIDALLFVAPLTFLYARLVLDVPVTWLGS